MTKLPVGKAVWTAEEWIQNSLKENFTEKTDEDIPLDSLEPNLVS